MRDWDDGDDGEEWSGGHDYTGPDYNKFRMAAGLVQAGKKLLPDALADAVLMFMIDKFGKPRRQHIIDFIVTLPQFEEHAGRDLEGLKARVRDRLKTFISVRYVHKNKADKLYGVPFYYWIPRPKGKHYLRHYGNITEQELADWAEARDRHIKDAQNVRDKGVWGVRLRFDGKLDPLD